jgi:hypothetical protein
MFATHLPHESWMADTVLLKNVPPRGGEAVDVGKRGRIVARDGIFLAAS